MIQAEGLTRYYGSFAAVQDATFEIGEREIVGFLGLNGAGKSTILKILAGLLSPTAGKVSISGVDVTERPDMVRKRIGFLPEEPPLYREMRVDDFLRWVGRVKGRSLDEVEASLPSTLATCQLDHVRSRVIGELSHGYKKRVGIAQAIIHAPDVVILDEPISGLDPQQIVDMRKVVQSLKTSATVLISSHILSEVAQTCDRVLVIHQGRIVAEGSEEELRGSLGEGNRITLHLVGKAAYVDRRLGASGLVKEHTLEEDGEEVIARLVLDGDVRERIVASLVEAKIGIRGVRDTASELEEIFLNLTQSHAQGTAPAKPPRSGPKPDAQPEAQT